MVYLIGLPFSSFTGRGSLVGGLANPTLILRNWPSRLGLLGLYLLTYCLRRDLLTAWDTCPYSAWNCGESAATRVSLANVRSSLSGCKKSMRCGPLMYASAI